MSFKAARVNPVEFIDACLTDASKHPVACADVHKELQAFLSAHRHALVELPRDHGKSTQVCGRVLWELGRNPGLRVKIVCATDAVAAERSRFIRDAIEHNVAVRTVFPHLAPGEPWAADAFTIKRPADVIGPSVAAFGIGAAHTGTRADLLVCDDVVDVRSLHSKAERERVADYFANNLMNLLEPDGRFWGLFTPWHRDDLNARLKRNAAYALFSQAVGADFEPVWPEKWPAERLRARKDEIGSASFARGYHLRPITDEETPIRAAWVKFWTEPAECEEVVLSIDPAVSTKERADRSALVVLGRCASSSCTGGKESALLPLPPALRGERVGVRGEFRSAGALHPLTPTLSPASGEREKDGSFRVTGEGHGGWGRPHVRVLAARAAKVSAPELVALIDAFDREWNPSVILFESNAAFAGIRDLLARQTRFGLKLKGVTQTADKHARVAALSVPVENGALVLKGDDRGPDESQRELFEEMTTFPFADRDDLLDATATGCAYLLDRREPRVW